MTIYILTLIIEASRGTEKEGSMKKIINGKVYDTDTAKEVGAWDNGIYGSFDSVSACLYRKRTGEYFIEKHDCYTGATIEKMSYEKARQWAEEHLDADTYLGEFDAVADDDSTVTVCYNIKECTRDLVENECRKTGETRSTVIDRIVAAALAR